MCLERARFFHVKSQIENGHVKYVFVRAPEPAESEIRFNSKGSATALKIKSVSSPGYYTGFAILTFPLPPH